MKEKIIIFIVGLLLGAIISTSSIYFYVKATDSNNNSSMQMPNDNQLNQFDRNGTPQNMPDNFRNNQSNN